MVQFFFFFEAIFPRAFAAAFAARSSLPSSSSSFSSSRSSRSLIFSRREVVNLEEERRDRERRVLSCFTFKCPPKLQEITLIKLFITREESYRYFIFSFLRALSYSQHQREIYISSRRGAKDFDAFVHFFRRDGESLAGGVQAVVDDFAGEFPA